MSPDLTSQTTGQLRAGLADHKLPCAKQPALFFEADTSVPYRESRAARQLRERSAAALCQGCPARALCLELALREPPAAGVWAGYTAQQIGRFTTDREQAA
ncbi:WhiB family transcriptional regulator [Nocardiopsis aegyptia]|uniref:WhiB family transcriptional regulator n=1 Tax=Nocardiopsis aegyptia TaxID=220378 RepID=UPI00366E80B2